jgi:hypothetical protein
MATNLPDPDQIKHRIGLCREELAELKRALRAVKAQEKADQARRARQSGGAAFSLEPQHNQGGDDQ